MSRPKCHKCIRFEDPRCHRCPDMPDGMIMPGCMGTAAFARHGHDRSRCTCGRRAQGVRSLMAQALFVNGSDAELLAWKSDAASAIDRVLPL